MQNHTSPSHPLAAPTSHTVSPTHSMGTTEENAAAPQGPLHPLIRIAQAYLSMLQQARHGLMQNGIEALKHALAGTLEALIISVYCASG